MPFVYNDNSTAV